MDGLTVRQEDFCMAYAKSGNATESCKQAGYSEVSAAAQASRLLRNVKVQERLRQINAQIESDKIMGAVEMQERLTTIARQEATEEVVLLGDGVVLQHKADFKAALKAMELLCRMQGAFLDRKEVEMKGVVPVVLKDDI